MLASKISGRRHDGEYSMWKYANEKSEEES